MPRLPVNPDNPSGAAPLTIRVSWAALAVFAALALVWYLGIGQLQQWLAVDVSCYPEPGIGRRARLAELVSCSLAAGPAGWLLLGWMASLPLALTFFLERAMRRAVKARGLSARKRQAPN